MFNACDTLSAAWLARKQEVERMVQQMGGNGAPGLFGPTSGYQTMYGSEIQKLNEVVIASSSNTLDLLTPIPSDRERS